MSTKPSFMFRDSQWVTQKPSGLDSGQLLVTGCEPAVIGYLRDTFVRERLQVTALSEEQAVLRVRQGFTPDVILLQVVGRDALGTLTALREARPNIPIIVVASFHDAPFVVKTMKLGATDCIRLPFDLEGLKASVRRSLSLVDCVADEDVAHETPLCENTSFVPCQMSAVFLSP